MLGWELRELGLRVTKNNKNSRCSQMRNERKIREKTEQKDHVTKITQISPGEELSETQRGAKRELRELREGLRNSGDSDHPFWRTQGAPPLGILILNLGNLIKHILN